MSLANNTAHPNVSWEGSDLLEGDAVMTCPLSNCCENCLQINLQLEHSHAPLDLLHGNEIVSVHFHVDKDLSRLSQADRLVRKGFRV